MSTLSINAYVTLFLGAALGFSLLFSDIIVGVLDAGKVGATQRLGQPTQGLLGHVPHLGVGVGKALNVSATI